MSNQPVQLDAIRLLGLKFARSVTTPRRVIASFDLDFRGIEISGCEMIRTASNGLTVRGPVSCNFADSATRHAVMQVARRAYVALGGDDLPDWARAIEPSANLVSQEAAE